MVTMQVKAHQLRFSIDHSGVVLSLLAFVVFSSFHVKNEMQWHVLF